MHSAPLHDGLGLEAINRLAGADGYYGLIITAGNPVRWTPLAFTWRWFGMQMLVDDTRQGWMHALMHSALRKTCIQLIFLITDILLG